MSAIKSKIPASRVSNLKKNNEDFSLCSRDSIQSTYTYSTLRNSIAKNLNNKSIFINCIKINFFIVSESPFKKSSTIEDFKKPKRSPSLKNLGCDISRINSNLDFTKGTIEIKDTVFNKTPFLSSFRDSCVTLPTNINTNSKEIAHNDAKTYYSNRIYDNKSPMKVVDRLTEDDLEHNEGVDLKALSLKSRKDQNQRNYIKLEKFVKEIELKEEKSKALSNNENLQTRPCCNESDCTIF